LKQSATFTGTKVTKGTKGGKGRKGRKKGGGYEGRREETEEEERRAENKAVGDPAIEETYAVPDRRIVIVPWDLRVRAAPSVAEPWLAARYEQMKLSLLALRPRR
jgi:hypothetical protein